MEKSSGRRLAQMHCGQGGGEPNLIRRCRRWRRADTPATGASSSKAGRWR